MPRPSTVAALYLATAVAGVVAAVWLVRKGAAVLPGAASAVADAVNPASSTNLVNRAANAIASPLFDIAAGNPLGTNVDSIGTKLYSWLNPNDNAGAIATAPVYPKPVQLLKLSDYATSVDLGDLEAGQGAFAIDLGEYADTVAGDDAAAGAFMAGFQVDDTAPAFINYNAAFRKRGTFQ
jgi:hypothetical protein